MSVRRQNLLAALVGIIAAVITLGVAEVVTLLVAPAASPLVVVGGWVIDIVPPWVKDTAIALFGTNDKVVLLLCLGLLVALLAAGIGILEYRQPLIGVLGLGVVAIIAAFAALTRANAGLSWVLPTVIGAVVGALVLRSGIRRLHDWVAADPQRARAVELSRRSFLGFAGATIGASLIAGLAARVVNSTMTAVDTVREALSLPAATVPAPAVPAGAELAVEGISPLFTPNSQYYRIDTALQVPVITPSTWSLRITGRVDTEIEISYDELIALPLIETDVTLACVSNEVGGGLIGNARWLGYPIRELLKKAGPHDDADMVLSRSIDGFTAGTPTAVLLDEDRDAILAVAMNGEPLPLEHGFPVRMVVPGLYGYVSATKWVTELKLTRFADETAYWTDRGWSALGPVKTSSRIDVPQNYATVAAGPVAVAGVAWAQHTGIDRVEVRVDGGAWQEATLAEAISIDTWRQWVFPWDATPGAHELEVRATDSGGTTQSGEPVYVAPNGAEGWHLIDVTVQ